MLTLWLVNLKHCLCLHPGLLKFVLFELSLNVTTPLITHNFKSQYNLNEWVIYKLTACNVVISYKEQNSYLAVNMFISAVNQAF